MSLPDMEKIDALIETLTPEQEAELRRVVQVAIPVIKPIVAILWTSIQNILTPEQMIMLKEASNAGE